MNFPYRRSLALSGVGLVYVHRPLIPVRIISPAGDADHLAFVDPGSDDTLLPRSVATRVGAAVDDTQAANTSGFGGASLPVAPGDVELLLTDGLAVYRWPAHVGFVTFADADDEMSILGHSGFLDFFTATFHGDRKLLELVPNPTFPGTIQ
jgi:hypothetical protein